MYINKSKQSKEDKLMQAEIEKHWLASGMSQTQLNNIKKHIEFVYQFKH